MTPLQLLNLTVAYRDSLTVDSVKANPQTKAGEFGRQLQHCGWMLDQMVGLIRNNEIEKAHRWLGFVQGTLWVLRIYSIDELKGHMKQATEHNHAHQTESSGAIQETR
jgi:hypothetical protein